MDVGTGGHMEHVPHHAHLGKVPLFSCILTALLESFEDAKINKKYMFQAISEDIGFRPSWGSMLSNPPPR